MSPSRNARQQRAERALPAHRVAIQPRDARAGTQALHFGLDALGAEARLLEVRRRRTAGTSPAPRIE